jgi:hypothetical protein
MSHPIASPQRWLAFRLTMGSVFCTDATTLDACVQTTCSSGRAETTIATDTPREEQTIFLAGSRHIRQGAHERIASAAIPLTST